MNYLVFNSWRCQFSSDVWRRGPGAVSSSAGSTTDRESCRCWNNFRRSKGVYQKYYCYSYFKSPFTDKNNLTKDLWPEQRCYSPFKGENSTAGELIPGRCNYQGTFFTASVENFTGHNDQLYPFGQKNKFVQEKTGRSYRISYYHYPPWQWYDRDLCYHTNPSVSIQGPRLEFSSFQ